ncbi:metallophosphoesterase family protein [bacterium]|nr:metallophosphoesterase family protein [bacterium]
MKIAIISDIHGNMEALNSVLNDIENEKCDKIFCLGDLAMAGPEPIIAIDKIKELMKSPDFEIIQGNTDEMLSAFSFDTFNKILEANEVMGNAYLADSQLLNDDYKKFLGSLNKIKEMEILGIKILLVHGSPRKNNENIYPDLKLEEVEEMIKDTNANVIFCGHTHMPCGYQTNTEQTVINVGSVGRPFSENPLSCYAIMEINDETGVYSVKHKLVEYDVIAASEKLRKRGFNGSEKLAQMLIKATSRYPQ